MNRLCACGCGEHVKADRDFIHYHDGKLVGQLCQQYGGYKGIYTTLNESPEATLKPLRIKYGSIVEIANALEHS